VISLRSSRSESVFERSCRSWNATEHGGGGGDADEGFGDVGRLFEVADEAAVLDEAGEGALDHPSPWQRLEPRRGAGPFDPGQREIGVPLRPIGEFACVSAIGEHGLDEGPEAASGAPEGLGAIAVLDAAGMDLNVEQTAVCVGQDVPLAPRDLLACVIGARTPLIAGSDRLAVGLGRPSVSAGRRPVWLASRPARLRSAISTAWWMRAHTPSACQRRK
jgi:hypothetical protein